MPRTVHVPIPESEIKEVLDALKERHRGHMKPSERLTFEGHINHGEAFIALGMSDPSEEEVLRLEGRIDLDTNDIQNPVEGRDKVMDFLDEALGQFFTEGRQWRPPLDWAEYEYEGSMLWIRGSLKNMKLERMANELLGDDFDPDA